MKNRRYLQFTLAGLVLLLVVIEGGRLWLHRSLYHISEADFVSIPSQCAVSDSSFHREINLGRRFIKKFMLENQSPSFSLAVAWKRRLIWSEAFGYINLEEQVPASPETRYRINSVSKPITGAALAKLYEARCISLDSTVQHYVPGFPIKAYPVTLRQLAAHTAGIRHYRSDDEVLNTRHFNNLDEALHVFADDSLLFRPGSQVKYSSFGFNLLGSVVEKASGQNYLDYIRKEVLVPANASGIGTEQNDTSQVRYYERRGTHPLLLVPPIDQSIKYPSGGLVGTPSDLVAFGAAYWQGEIVSPETVALFTQMQRVNSGEETGFGLGWELSRTPSKTKRLLIETCAALGFYLPQATGFYESVYHRGGASGSISGLVIYKNYDLVLAFVSNANGEGARTPWKLPTFMMEQFIRH
ncbi:MAG: serine hydrolase domain-containing protein [Saprospiraceae bacterium]|nr:serine hydrolase domain-containing protein [Saprospiraceae bacterium]MDZ4704977.1 serine hydrolase domain-containing protein [Saprospiraceae bacterium]